jgi:putative transposase
VPPDGRNGHRSRLRQSRTGACRLGYRGHMSSHRRLDLESYAVPGTTWHVSTPTLNRRPIFRDQEIARQVVDSLRFQCSRCDAALLVYCLMPDHLHAVITIGAVYLITILQGMKSYTTTLWRRRSGEQRLWQGSFHDHGVRRAERMDELVKYVIENPQRTPRGHGARPAIISRNPQPATRNPQPRTGIGPRC